MHIEDVNFLLITCSFKLTCEAGYKYENKSSEFICQHKAVWFFVVIVTLVKSSTASLLILAVHTAAAVSG